MRSHVGAVAAVTGVEAFTAAPLMSGVERFVAAVTLLPVEDTPVEDMQLRDAAMDTAAMDRPVARAAVGAAAVGAAAGAYGYYGGYNNRCYQDAYGNQVCPQYPY